MELARRAQMLALVTLLLCAVASAQTLRPANDPRNTAPTIGTGGPIGGPTGLFTVYDGQTLRRGEFTFSAAYSNFDRDPGNVDITEIPVSFQVGLGDYLEVFFNTDAYKQYKVNSAGRLGGAAQLSGFLLPNSFAGAAIVQGPIIAGGSRAAIFRPARGQITSGGFSGVIGQPFVQFPFVGGAFGGFGRQGTPAGDQQSQGTLGATANAGGGGSTFGAADNFPGIGSPFGSILPGIVFTTTTTPRGTLSPIITPTSFLEAPAYLPDAPFLSRTYGQTAFNTFVAGAKIRVTDVNSSTGVALIPFYRFYAEKGDDFNQLNRGASPAGDLGDFGGILAIDSRLARVANLSANIGYIFNSNPKATIGGQEFTLLDRPDELLTGIGFDFPVNRYFQPIAELRSTIYVGGRTPNSLQNNPIDGLAGVRIYPARYVGFSAAYRRHFNQQDREFGENIPGFTPSDDPNGFLFQFFIGRRNERAPDVLPNQPPVVNVTATGGTPIADGGTSIVVCPRDPSLASPANSQVQITSTASDPDGDTLLYTYTTTAGRIVGEGPNVTLDLTGVAPGTNVTVTSEVDDGCGCIAFDTTNVNVTECEPAPPVVVDCPTVTLSCVDSVNVGSPATLTANISGGDQNVTPTFNWTVTAGTITSGQGTPSITVDTTGLGGQSFTATATVGGYDPTCQNAQSCTVQVIGAPETARLFDTYGDVLDDDAKPRLDNLAIELQNSPTSRTTIFGYGGRTGDDRRRRNGQARADFARDYLINQRGIDAGRITTVDGGFREEAATELYIVPSGAAEPTASPNVDASEVQPRRAPRRRRGRR
ncbi:MAG: hypothetical protein MSG64_03030 [Pyrinomonadaceae bacterium MAG19_C2-C3]|nr:hypothetical protein [Pyrinomonadaceae bacterium MAG19_C2-C3]